MSDDAVMLKVALDALIEYGALERRMLAEAAEEHLCGMANFHSSYEAWFALAYLTAPLPILFTARGEA